MNYKAIGLNTLVEYAEENNFTLGQTLFSFLREPISGMNSIKELMEISDEDMYTIIEKAKNLEQDEPLNKE